MGLLLVLLLGGVLSVTGQVVINEAMVNEPGGYQSLEWIELYATSDTMVSLSVLDLQVDGTSLDLPQADIGPGEYLVLCRRLVSIDGAASFEGCWGDSSGVWGDTPSELAIRQPLEVTMQLRNDDGVIELTCQGQIISELAWSEAGPDGVSLERIHPDSEQISLCRALGGSTPGYINSQAPVANDLSMTSATVTSRDGWCELSVGVVNYGTAVNSECDLLLIYPTDSTLLEQFAIVELAPGSRQMIQGTYLLAGMRQPLSLILPDDDRADNNRLDFWAPGEEFPPVVLSEVMPNPQGSPDAEWVEIRLIGSVPADLNGWQLGDAKRLCLISDSTLIAEPGERPVLTKDSVAFRTEFGSDGPTLEPLCWPILNNAADTVRLVDPYGLEADRFVYTTVLGDDFCWSRGEDDMAAVWGRSATPGGTPGLENEVVWLDQDGAVRLSVSPRVFSPDADGVDDSTVSSISPVPNDLAIRIFDRQGRLVKEFAQHQAMTGRVVWHGKSDGGSDVPIGIYIVLVEGDGEAAKQAVVVAP
ncbi:MAG: lamin tail domain-containing protein [bacterium]